MTSFLQTREQERAAHAWSRVEELKKDADQDGRESVKKKYGGLVRRLPAHVMTSGLGPTLAFLRAKAAPKKDGTRSPEAKAHERAYASISSWVVTTLPGQPQDLLRTVTESGSDVYRLATVEALAYLTWLKRFADAELPEDDDH